MDDYAYDLGSQKHVFIDWALIEPGYGVAWASDKPDSWEMPHGARIAVHRPRIDAEPFLRPDRPWETSVSQPSLLDDEGLYRLYYRVQRQDAGPIGPADSMLAYAESTDGSDWVKPNLGLVEHDGSKDNNLVYGMEVALGRPMLTGSVFKDVSAPDDERYKLVYRSRGNGRESIYGAVSPDGVEWKTLEKPIIPGYFSDTLNVAAFDARKGRYVGYFRGWTVHRPGKLHGRRTIAYSETEDFAKWPPPRTIVSPDMHDGPDTDIYTNSYTPWPGADAHLMFPAFYQRNLDVMEIHIMTSRDGLDWQRPIRAPIVPRGEPGSGGEGSMSAGRGLASLREGEWSLAFTMRPSTHNEGHYDAVKATVDRGNLHFATWRADGFTSLEADSFGQVTTIPFTFTGNRLEINAWTRFGGEIAFEVADSSAEAMGRPTAGQKAQAAQTVAGRSFTDCDTITGDNIRRTVTWRGESDLSSLAGKPVRLRIRMRRARLYAVQFA